MPYSEANLELLQESIDFGLLPSNGPPATIKLLLLNSGNKPIPVQNVIATPVTEALQIDFSPTKIPPDTMKPTVVAEVKFDRKSNRKRPTCNRVRASSHLSFRLQLNALFGLLKCANGVVARGPLSRWLLVKYS